MGNGRWRVRRYESPDFGAVVGLLANAFVSSSTESVRFSLSTPNTAGFVAEARGRLVGIAMAIHFGRTGWVGSVVVSSDCQRQGIGSALTERAVESLIGEVGTVLLLALEPGRRMYERLGFVDDGSYGTWVLPPAGFEAAGSLVPRPRAARVAPQVMRCLSSAQSLTCEPRARIVALTWSRWLPRCVLLRRRSALASMPRLRLATWPSSPGELGRLSRKLPKWENVWSARRLR